MHIPVTTRGVAYLSQTAVSARADITLHLQVAQTSFSLSKISLETCSLISYGGGEF